jgi:AraC-like DNA-binding protein
MHTSESLTPPPQCLFAAELHMQDGQDCFMHSHACTEIIWFRGCKGWLLQHGERLRYSDGDIGIYQPGEEHGDACEAGGIQMCVGVNGSGAEKLAAGIWPADASTLTALERLRSELERHDAWQQGRLNLLSGCVVMELSRQIAAQAGESSRAPYAVQAARRIFDTRFSEPLTVAGVTAELGVGPDYLRQAFVKWVGEPPIRYLIRKRLDAACDLLRLNQEPAARIAERVGIPNPYYFSRLFRQRMGTTPTQYRNRHAGG